MSVSEGDLMMRVACEIKRVLRQNREVLYTPEYLAELVVERDPLIHQEACLWGASSIRHTWDGKTALEPDMELVECWVRSTFRKFKEKADRFGKWINRHYYVTKFCSERGRYYLQYNPASDYGFAER